MSRDVTHEQETERRNSRGRLLCNAKNNTCNGLAMRGSRKCRSHGGATPKGMDSPHFKHGQRSRYLKVINKALQGKLRAALACDLLNGLDDLALLQMRLFHILETGESRALWTEANKKWREFMEAYAKEGVAAIARFSADFDGIFKAGVEDSRRWREVYEVLERMGVAREQEHKRATRAQEYITRAEAMQFVHMIYQVLDQNVTDLGIRVAITQALAERFGGPDLAREFGHAEEEFEGEPITDKRVM